MAPLAKIIAASIVAAKANMAGVRTRTWTDDTNCQGETGTPDVPGTDTVEQMGVLVESRLSGATCQRQGSSTNQGCCTLAGQPTSYFYDFAACTVARHVDAQSSCDASSVQETTQLVSDGEAICHVDEHGRGRKIECVQQDSIVASFAIPFAVPSSLVGVALTLARM